MENTEKKIDLSYEELLSFVLDGHNLTELMELTGKSMNGVINIISVLKKKGLLDRDFKITKDFNQNKKILKKEVKETLETKEIAETIEAVKIKDESSILEKIEVNEEIISEEINNVISKTSDSRNIKAVKVKFEEALEVSYNELFDGYEELYAITFSSSPDFIYNLCKKFDYTEIIFGCSDALNGTITNLFASQISLMKIIKKSSYFNKLKELYDKNSLDIYLLQGKISHQKIYILKGEDKYRVIVGSANMSSRAFNGIQEENITYMDTYEAYRYYKDLYEKLKLKSGTELDLNIIEINKDFNEEDTPIYGVIKEKETIYLDKSKDLDNDIFDFTTDARDIEENLKEYLPESIGKKNLDKMKVTFDDVSKALTKRDFILEEKAEERKEFPVFNINRESKEISFNGIDFKEFVKDNYPNSNIKTDIICLHKFFKGLDSFIGDSQHSKYCYWKFLVVALASPFFTECRKIAHKYNHSLYAFPMYSFIYGDSNGSKTSIIKLVETLMFGKVFPFNSDSEFKPTYVFGLKNKMEGVPIIFDDLSSSRFSEYGSKIMKEDYYDIKHKTNSPMIVITSNSTKSVKPEISKRCVVLNISAKLNQLTGMENEKIIGDIMSNISPKFYMEYIERIIPKVNKMIENMEDGIYPDIFKISSETIIEIIGENFNGKVPSYMGILTWEDYFGDSNIGFNVLKELNDYYIFNKEFFKANRKRNSLEVYFEDAFVPRRLINELPKSMEAQVYGKKLVLNLSESEKFLKIKLRTNIATETLKNVFKKKI